jgi:3',5'-cyclic-AMP phosphodiesterase
LSLFSRRHFLFGLAGFTLLPFAQEAEALVGAFKPFKFGYVTGSYLVNGQPDSYKLLQESQLFLQDAVKHLNREDVDFVIFGGDNVENPGHDEVNWQLFVDVVQLLSCPWNFILGEQDVSGKSPVDKMKTYGPDWKGKGIDTNKPYWSQDPVTGVHLIGLDTSQPNSTTGYLAKSQLDWFKADLNSNRNKFTIVVSHHPLLPPAPFDGGPPWDDYIVPQGATAREIMGTHSNVRLALSGHVHISKIQQEKNVWHVSSPSLAVYPCAYRIFNVTPDCITVETYEISFPALIKKAKKEIENWSLPYKYSPKPQAFIELMEGSRGDQNARLPLVAGKPKEAFEPKKRKEDKPSEEDHEGRGLFKKKKKKIEEEPVKTPPSKHAGPEKEAIPEKNATIEKKPAAEDKVKKETPADTSTTETAPDKANPAAQSDSTPAKGNSAPASAPDVTAPSADTRSVPGLEASPAGQSKSAPATNLSAPAGNSPTGTQPSPATATPDSVGTPNSTGAANPPSPPNPTGLSNPVAPSQPPPVSNPAVPANPAAMPNPAAAPNSQAAPNATLTPNPDLLSPDATLKLRPAPDATGSPTLSPPAVSNPQPATAPAVTPDLKLRTTPPKEYPPPVQ